MTTSPSPSPDPRPVLDLIEAFRRSKTMFTAVSLGVFDKLAGGPANAASVAAGIASADTMARLLDACVSLGLLIKSGDQYSNTAVADAYLRRESPHTLAGYILYSDQVLYPLWEHLDDAIGEGTHRWKQAFGLEGGAIFSHFYKTSEDMRDFLMGMHGNGSLSSPAVVAAFDLSAFRRIVDLGGATGHLAIAAAERYPQMESAVFDLPRVIAFARPFVAGTRVELLEGDFFADPLPAADLYAVGQILHDWTEGRIAVLLRKIYAALPAGGGLLIAERLLDDDHSGPIAAHMQSLNMLVCTEGRERSLAEYSAILRDAGFAQVEGKRTGARLDAVLARKR